MKITQADIHFAELAAFKQRFPTLRAKLKPKSRWSLTYQVPPYAAIHSAVGAHAGLSGYGASSYKYRTYWHNMIQFIRGRDKRGEQWRGHQHWGNGGAGTEEYVTIMGRISRRLRKAETR